jgi:RNA polymerase sigma factor (sigma-70 family)
MAGTASQTDGAASAADVTDFVEEQYRLHAPAVLRKCLFLGGGNRAWAEEVMHDVFLRLMERASDIDRGGNVRGWLITAAYRHGIDRLRREGSIWGRVREVLGRVAPGGPRTPEQKVRLQRDLERVRDAVAELPATERAVLAMKHIDGMSQREIAGALGLSEATVSRHLSRVSKRFADAGWEVES